MAKRADRLREIKNSSRRPATMGSMGKANGLPRSTGMDGLLCCADGHALDLGIPRHHMIERWHGALMRRSQRHRLTWTRMKTIAGSANPRILHP